MERRADEKLALISEEAAEWLVRLKDERLGFAERRRYHGWLKQSPAHIAEILRLRTLQGWLRGANLQDLATGPDFESNIVGFAKSASPSDSLKASWWHLNWRRWHFATAFSVLAVVAMFGVAMHAWWSDSSIDTDVGEWRRVTLSDGSVVSVGPKSKLSFDFNDRQRSVYLTRGEALFQVSKNPNRPFFVNTDLAIVRAVGTQFGVARRDGQVFVTVKEGKVAVTQGEAEQSPVPITQSGTAASAESTTLALVADERIAVSPRKWPAKAERVDATREFAWAQGHLIFDSTTTVGQAADEFNRRNRLQIVVEDPGIAALNACCVFNIDDPTSFAESVAIGSKHGVALVREGPEILRLVPVEPGTGD
ncbi:MAG TPA: FecR domain-containing protein [Steroidobacteraceae bacterium]|jgi:transmembrane sensor